MLDFKSGLDGFFHSLIPRELRENIGTYEPEYIRIRAFSAVLVFSAVLLAVEIFAVGVWHIFHNANLLKYDLLALGIFSLLIIQVILFYKFNHYWLSALAFTSLYFLMIVILIVMSGGHHSAMKSLLLTCPFIAFLIGGKHEGIQTSLLTALIGVVLAFLDAIDFETPDLFMDENPLVVFCVDWIISLSVIIMALIVYESALQKDGRTDGVAPHHVPRPFRQITIEGLNKLFHRLVPPLLRDSLSINSMAYIRARFLSVLLLLLVTMGILTTVPMITGFWLLHPEPSGMILQNLAVIAMLLLFIFQSWLFYLFGNQRFSGLLFASSYFLVVVAMIMSSGGYDSSLKYFLLTYPLIAFVVCGMREGIINAFFTVIAGVSLAGFKRAGFEFADIFTGGFHPYLVFSANWVVTLGIIVACIVVYETELQT